MEDKHIAKKDIISSIPATIIEIILCRVPIRDAVRTSILSRYWRYKWATIPKLVFDGYHMVGNLNHELPPEVPPYIRKYVSWESRIFSAIQQVLLLHEGLILEFKLYMDADKTCFEMDQIILHLSRRNTVKKLALLFYKESFYKLPLSVLSFHQLTDLFLSRCEFDFSPTFSGFGSLRNLSLDHVYICGETLEHLISSCPLLEFLILQFWDPAVVNFTFDLNKLFKCLRGTSIQQLVVSSWTIECSATGELPTTLVCLESLYMPQMQFGNEYRLLALFRLIKSSPNLQEIKLTQDFSLWDPKIISLDDYSNIWLEHLIELEIEDFSSTEPELEFVKLILAKSPVLKKVRLLHNGAYNDEEMKILRILLCLPRASPLAEFIFKD